MSFLPNIAIPKGVLPKGIIVFLPNIVLLNVAIPKGVLPIVVVPKFSGLDFNLQRQAVGVFLQKLGPKGIKTLALRYNWPEICPTVI
jgi:hypothetical protein